MSCCGDIVGLCSCVRLQERPGELQARVLQLRNLMMQGMGREREVPHRAIRALQEAGAWTDELYASILLCCCHCMSAEARWRWLLTFCHCF
jgi:hypothetical protein